MLNYLEILFVYTWKTDDGSYYVGEIYIAVYEYG